MSSRDRNVLILGLLVIALLVVGYYFLILSPLLNNLDERAQERDDKEAQLANLQQEVAQLEAIRREAPEIQRQLLELSKRVPTQPEIATFVVQIEEVADASGVTELRIERGTPEPGGGDFSVVPITMFFNGTYEEMQDFLLRTRNLSRLVTVRSVTYCLPEESRVADQVLEDVDVECPEQEGGGAGETTALEGIEQVLEVQVEAEVYFQPSGVPAGTPPTAPTPPETTTPPDTTTPAAPEETTGG